jgi:hypothetical protein
MPITYREEKKRALTRLHAKVEAAGNALSIILFLQNESFVGCELQLAKLEVKLFSNS